MEHAGLSPTVVWVDHFVVILGKTLQASLSPPRCINNYGKFNARDPVIDYRAASHPGGENAHLMLQNIIKVNTTLYIPLLPLHQTVQPHHTSRQSLHLHETTEHIPVMTSTRQH